MRVVREIKTDFLRVMSTGDTVPIEFRVTDYMRECVEELIRNKTRCVCVFDSLSDYKYSTISSSYKSISPVDAGGFIESVNWKTNELTIELDDKYADEESAYYVKPDEWNEYIFIIRATTQIEYEKLESGEDHGYGTITELFGLDLINERGKN